MNYTLVIDQGTHASRAILFDEQGVIVNQQHIDIHLNHIDHETIEQDAEEIIASIDQALKRLDQQLLKKTKYCSIATQRSTIVAWNKATGKALYPAISWQDRRSHDDIQTFKTKQSEIKKITGLPLSAHYGAGKIRWLLTNDAQIRQYQKKNQLCIGPLASFILFRLLKEKPIVVDHSNAQRMLLLDLNTKDWSETLLTLFNIPKNILPVCQPIQFNYGHLFNGTPVTAVCGDQNASLFSMGAIDNNSAYVNLGTGAFVLKAIDKPITDSPFLCGIANSNTQQHLYLLEATVNGAGSALSWLQQQYPVDNLYQKLVTWLNRTEHPPLFINTVGGLGSPWWNSAYPAYFINDNHATIEDRYTAVIESIVFLLSENIRRMQAYSPINQLYLSGGLSRLDGLCQRLADLSQLDVNRQEITEATAQGAAWLATDKHQWPYQPQQGAQFRPTNHPSLMTRYQQFIQHINEL